ncbi:MAG: PH domain-containing protein [Candidatus Nezhaarchaeota archaeon]|nr:PH domain-containing protein [Candidatus Nezhaarchaeota archaeon]
MGAWLRVTLKDRLYAASPRGLKLLGALCFSSAGFLFLLNVLLAHYGYMEALPPLALISPFALMGLMFAGMWLFMAAWASSSFERKVARYVSKEELARIESEVEAELHSLKGKGAEVARRVMVKRRVEELYRKRVEEEFLEALKRRFKFKAGESILSVASGQWSGSTIFLLTLPLIIIASVVLGGWLSWLFIAVLMLMAIYFSSLTQSVLYVATNRRLIKRTLSSSLLRRSERGEELRWSAIKQVSVSRGRRSLKIRLKGEGEILDVDGLRPSSAEQLLKIVEAQVAAAKSERALRS